MIDYTGRIKDTGKIFETTDEQVARANSIYDSNVGYGPKLVSIGSHYYPVNKGFDEGLETANPGEKLNIEVLPDKGFGKRDPNKIRIIPIRKLGDEAEKISVGDTIEIDNKKGRILFIGSGRVKIDYNHELAGKTIVYETVIVKHLESDTDKINAIINENIIVTNSQTSFKLENDSALIDIPAESFNSPNLNNAKNVIATDIFKFIPTIKKVVFSESYINKNLSTDTQNSVGESQISDTPKAYSSSTPPNSDQSVFPEQIN